MTGFLGMDPDAVRDSAERLRTASTRLDALRGDLETAARTVPWSGDDAESFRDRWAEQGGRGLALLSEGIAAMGEEALAEADQQDEASAAESPREQATDASGGLGAPPGQPSGRPSADLSGEAPLESGFSSLTGALSDAIGWSVDSGIDLLEDGVDALGSNSDGIAQFQRDVDRFGGILEDWVTGERVPTVAEIAAAALLAGGSAGVGVYEAVTGEDTPLLDDRPGGIVTAIEVDERPVPGPRTLQDLVLANDALRIPNDGQLPLDAGRIGIQEVQGAEGGDPVYIVQVPPTEGAGITDVPGSYGEQGNSRDWASNLRLVAGQRTAATEDVLAAMDAAGIPAGAEVLLVGHSQGGIIAHQLAADPSVNRSTGAEGTYDVRAVLSMGSPVQTVAPAQSSTVAVNVHHGAEIGADGIAGDLIPTLDLGGLQLDGGTLEAPNRHEVELEGYPVRSADPFDVLQANHDSTGPDDEADGGYAGSLARSTAEDPTLSAFQDELTGVFLGEGTTVTRSQVVTVGRGPAA
ncbi:WXG100 family type VII secretion target [Brachybacterium sp. DNPG3]